MRFSDKRNVSSRETAGVDVTDVICPRSDLGAGPAAPVPAPKLHWLRAEFNEAKNDADKLRIAQELLRRVESTGDVVEAVRWREEVAKQAPKSPPPQPLKP